MAGHVLPSHALGVYDGNDASAVTAFEQWLGRPVDGVLAYVGDQGWSDYDAGWAVDLWSQIDRPVFWSVPLIPNGATLQEAATGAYDDHYRQVASELAGTRPEDPTLIVRTGWEFNGNWFAWHAAGQEDAFIGAWHHFVDSFRSVSDRFAFDWCPNIGDLGMDPAKAYPGDNYVDIIGVDVYYLKSEQPDDNNAAWDWMLNEKYGLQWHHDFAEAHHKPMSYPEWGVQGDSVQYLDHVAQWFQDNPVSYQTLWDSNSAYAGKLSDGQYGATGDEYRALFANTHAGEGTPIDGNNGGTTPPPADHGNDGNLAITAHVSGDSWQGAPHMQLLVDGSVIAETEVGAAHAKGEWQDVTATVPAGAQEIAVAFTNDDWGGTAEQDRNLYVDHVTVNDTTLTPDQAAYHTDSADLPGQEAMVWSGRLAFHVPGSGDALLA